MKKELEKIVQKELDEFHYILDRLNIADITFKRCGLSALMIEVYENSGVEYQQQLAEARSNFDFLCEAAPDFPRDAMKTISLTYSMLVILIDPRSECPTDLSVTVSLMASAFCRGLLEVLVSGKPATDETNRKNFLSEAGKQGAEAKNLGHKELKAWALKEAKTMYAPHVDIARRLAALLPAHLADVSRDPKRLIYDTLRNPKKPD